MRRPVRYLGVQAPRLVSAAITGLILAACGSAPAAVAPPPPPPLATSFTTADGTWALLPLGRSDQALETFWQAFYLAGPPASWALRTPPGVADNGGLIFADAGASTVLGVRASNLLSFSPLAITTDGGRSYTPSLMPGALAAVPDALTVGPDGDSRALTSTEILTRSGGGAWTVLVSAETVAGTSAARLCGVQHLTAVADSGSGVLMGAACARAGTVGILARTAGTVTAVGPRLPPSDVADRVVVLRLVSDPGGVAALLELDGGAGRSYVAAWRVTRTGRWRLSPPLRAPGRLLSSGVISGSGFAVVVAGPGATLAATTDLRRPGWDRLPALPASASTLAESGGRVDALAGGVTTFTDYRLTAGVWIRAQVLSVPVPFGSSG